MSNKSQIYQKYVLSWHGKTLRHLSHAIIASVILVAFFNSEVPHPSCRIPCASVKTVVIKLLE